MTSSAAVEDYVDAAVRHAVSETLEDCTIAATIPEIFGVVGLGVNEEECLVNLRERVEDWVRLRLSSGQLLPVLDGIDLNRDQGRTSTVPRQPWDTPGERQIFADEHELEAALRRWATEADELHGSS
jgi:hypothetical protein